jgi:hypothetical protein
MPRHLCEDPVMPPKRLRRFVRRGCGVAALLLVHSMPGLAADDASVQWARGRLSVQAGSMPLVEVLKTIRALTGIEIRGDGALADPVTKGFEALPLPDALGRLLAHTNHMIVQRGPRQPLLVVVLGGASAGGAAALPAPLAAAFNPPRAVTQTLAPTGAAGAAQQAAQQAALQRAQQGAQQNWRETALNSTDPAARAEAVQRLAESAAKGDADSQAVLRQALNDPSDAVRAIAQQALVARDQPTVKRPSKELSR